MCCFTHTLQIKNMKKVKLKFPQIVLEFKYVQQIVLEFKYVEITDTEFDGLPHLNCAEKAQLIEKHLDEIEQQHIPGELSVAVEHGYAAIISA